MCRFPPSRTRQNTYGTKSNNPSGYNNWSLHSGHVRLPTTQRDVSWHTHTHTHLSGLRSPYASYHPGTRIRYRLQTNTVVRSPRRFDNDFACYRVIDDDSTSGSRMVIVVVSVDGIVFRICFILFSLSFSYRSGTRSKVVASKTPVPLLRRGPSVFVGHEPAASICMTPQPCVTAGKCPTVSKIT